MKSSSQSSSQNAPCINPTLKIRNLNASTVKEVPPSLTVQPPNNARSNFTQNLTASQFSSISHLLTESASTNGLKELINIFNENETSQTTDKTNTNAIPPNLQSLQLTSVVHENSNANNKSNSYSPKDKGLISIRNELAS